MPSKSWFAHKFLNTSISILRPIRGWVTASTLFAVTILTINFKYTVEGSSWFYSAINAVMITVGIGLAILSTAVMTHDEKHK
jgi:hypothetical protein